MNTPTLETALEHAERIHDVDVLDAAISRVAAEIDATLDGEPALFLTVMQGALPFAGQLATRVATPLVFDYIHATRYRGATSGGELHWLKRPNVSLAGKIVLLIDDILDEGHTLAGIRDYCVAQGAARVLIAVLCEKRHGRGAGLVADFVGVEVPDRYVFGYGMDYHEQGRNIAAIYAVDA